MTKPKPKPPCTNVTWHGIDFLNIAAAVTDGEPHHLLGDLRKDAIAAMHALGYSRTHIAAVLCIRPARAAELARRIGLRLHDQDQRPDPLAVEFACQGTRMKLRGVDRDEAVRQMGTRHEIKEIGRRVGIRADFATALASRLQVTGRVPWTYSGRPPARSAA